VIIALNGPQEETVGQIRQFQKLFLAPGFLTWGGSLIVASIVIVVFFAPKYGKKSMLWYIFVCSMIGGLSVSCTTGLGAAIVTSFQGDNQVSFLQRFFQRLIFVQSVQILVHLLLTLFRRCDAGYAGLAMFCIGTYPRQ
jgi:magnesium transporter